MHADDVKISTTGGPSEIRPQHALITIYKSFVRPHLDGDVIYDQPNNERRNHKIKRIQYNAVLEITCATKGTSQSKLYNSNELGFEFLLNLDVGFGNYELFIKSKQLEHQNTCSILFLKPIIYSYIYNTFLSCYNILQQN